MTELWKSLKDKYWSSDPVVFESIKIYNDTLDILCSPRVLNNQQFTIELIVAKLNGYEYQGKTSVFVNKQEYASSYFEMTERSVTQTGCFLCINCSTCPFDQDVEIDDFTISKSEIQFYSI